MCHGHGVNCQKEHLGGVALIRKVEEVAMGSSAFNEEHGFSRIDGHTQGLCGWRPRGQFA